MFMQGCSLLSREGHGQWAKVHRDWRKANTAFVLKKDSESNPGNYRLVRQKIVK